MGCIPSQPVSDPVSDSRTEGRSGGRPDSSGGRPDSSGGRPDSSSAKSRRHAATNGGDAAVTARLDEKKAESLNGVPSGRKSRGSSRAAAIDDADTIRPQSAESVGGSPSPAVPTPDQQQRKDDIVEAALRGRLDFEYPLTSRIVRIFTSSTFTDTRAERNALMERVYPGLKAFCQRRGFEFQVVDMRWGVRDEATDDHMTSELCMKELSNCQKLSTGPNFITFLAQKYGYRPFPPKIPAAEFDALVSAVSDVHDLDLLREWFILDSNIVPPVYILHPIREKLPHYADDSQPERKKEARSEWWKIFERLQLTLRDAATKKLSPSEAHKYLRSVTEEEIFHGVLRAARPGKECFWFRRQITDLQEHVEEKTCSRYMDIAQKQVDVEAQTLLSKLRDQEIPKCLPKENIQRYEVKWTENGVDPAGSKDHQAYVDTFCKDFRATLERMIVGGIAEHEHTHLTDELHTECVQHAAFAQEKCKMFHGRQHFLDVLKSRVTSDDHVPIVLTGEPGSGKTSLMAKLVEQVPEWLGSPPTLVRFCGTTGQSSSTRDLLVSLCKQICHITDQSDKELPDDLKSIKDLFTELVTTTTEELVLVIDSLDQLRDLGAGLRGWIPNQLSDSVTMVLSAIPGEQFKVVPELQGTLPERCFIAVPPLDSDDVSAILESWLHASRRALQPRQMELLRDACARCRIPLFTKIAFDETRRWRSYTDVTSLQIGDSVPVLINTLLDRVEVYHGKVLVAQALAVLTAAKSGISLPELEDVLSCDDDVLNDVYQYHTPPLRRLPPLLWVRIQDDLDAYLVTAGADGVQVIRWYHRQFQTVATERYLSNDIKRQYVHEQLANFFSGTWAAGAVKGYRDRRGNSAAAERFVASQPLVFKEGDGATGTVFNLRKMNELPYHLCKLCSPRNFDRLKAEVLCNYDFLYEKIRAQGIMSVLDDFMLAEDFGLVDEETKQLRDLLNLAKDALVSDPQQFPIQLSSRLAPDHPRSKDMIQQALRPNFPCLVSSHSVLGNTGPLVNKFVGHESPVQAMALDTQADLLVSADGDGVLKVWKLSNAREMASHQMPTDGDFPFVMPQLINWMKLCLENKCVVFPCHKWLFVVDIGTGLPRHNMDQVIKDDDSSWDKWSYGLLNDTTLAVLTDVLAVWELASGKLVLKHDLGEPPAAVPGMTTPTNFVGGFEKHLVCYQAGRTEALVLTVDAARGAATEAARLEVVSPAALQRGCCPLLLMMPGGSLVAFHYAAMDMTEVAKYYNTTLEFGTLRVFDVRKGKRVKQVDKGILSGINYANERLLLYAENELLLITMQVGALAMQVVNVESGRARIVSKQGMVVIKDCMGSLDGKLYMTNHTDQSKVEVLDLRREESGGGGGAAADALGAEPVLIMEHPHAPRYVGYMATTGAIKVWDVAKRCTVRSATFGWVAQNSAWTSPTTVVGVLHDMCVAHFDAVSGKTLFKSQPWKYKPRDQHVRVAALSGTEILLMGPEANQISVMDLKSGRTLWTVSAQGKVEMSGLVVSDNKSVAICNPPLGVHSGGGSGSQVALIVFDLKKREFLRALQIKGNAQPHTATALEHGNASWTPDGRHFLSVVYTDDGVEVVSYNLFTGKQKMFPHPQYVYPAQVKYSTGLEQAVIYYVGGAIRTYDVPSMTQHAELGGFGDDSKHFSRVWVSPDGTWAAFTTTSSSTELHFVNLNSMERFARFRADGEVTACVFNRDNTFVLLAIKNVQGLFQACLCQRQHIEEQKRSKNQTVEDALLADVAKNPDLFGKPVELTVQAV